MNKFEECIIQAIEKAHTDYMDMAGEWLYHAPESFMQTVIAQRISEENYWIYPDVSFKKVFEFLGKLKGRPSSLLTKRADIVVWQKSTSELKAAIEIKRARSVTPINKDAIKLKRILKMKFGPKLGYIVAYSETGRNKRMPSDQLLLSKFRKWCEIVGGKEIFSEAKAPDPKFGYSWGYCLIRFDRV